jgi:queuosine precursor transporter
MTAVFLQPMLQEFLVLSAKFQIRLATLGMVVAIALSNYLVQFEINEWLTWGAFTYPITFLITELTNRFHGPRLARRVVYVGFLFALILSLFLNIPRIALASAYAFLIGQLLDILVFNRLRQKSWWVAPAFSSVAASALDTLIFFSIAFAPSHSWIRLALGDFSVKLLMDILMLLPFRMMLWGSIKRTRLLES